MTGAVTGAAATLLVLLLAHHTRLQPAGIGCGEAVPVGLMLGFATAASASSPRAVIVVLVAVLGTAAAVVDAHEGRLPNVLTATLGGGLLVAVATTAFLTRHFEGLVRASVAAVLTVGVALVVKVVCTAMVGWGDVKLLLSLTAALAWAGLPALAHGLVLWMLLLLATAAVWRVGCFEASETVPYGPALVVGTLGALLLVT